MILLIIHERVLSVDGKLCNIDVSLSSTLKDVSVDLDTAYSGRHGIS